MSRSHSLRALLLPAALAAIALLLSCCCSLPAHAAAPSPCDAPALTNGQSINVAILVIADCPFGVLPANPNTAASGCKADTQGNAATTRLVQWGIEMYVKEMQRQQPMPLKNGQTINWNYTYINFPVQWLGSARWGAPNWSNFSTTIGNETQGIMYDVLMSGRFGGPFSFVIPPVFMANNPTLPASAPYPELPGPFTTIMNIAEEHNAGIVIHPFGSGQNLVYCYVENGKLQADCIRRGRLEGSRRFNNLLGVLFDSTGVAGSALDQYYALGVRKIAVISELGYYSIFATDASVRTIEFAKQLNIRVVSNITLELCNPARVPTNCPRDANGNLVAGQTQVFPNGMTGTDVARQLRDAGTEVITLIGSAAGRSALTLSSVFDGMREIGWTPKMINWAGGVDGGVKPFMTNYDDLLGTWSTSPWDARLAGLDYRNKRTPSNFELFPATTGKDGPRVFADAFTAFYASVTNGTFYDFAAQNTVLTAIGFHALTIAQKVVEAGLTSDVASLATASLRVSTPSVYHKMQFDPSGRTNRVNECLNQYRKNVPGLHLLALIAPVNIGDGINYPLPTWSERVFNPQMYSENSEVAMAVITGICIFAALIMMAVLLSHAKHGVIRAATPSFCVLTIIGAIMMLLSNFFHTLVASDSHCAAQVWLLSLGFTILFASLFVKTFRIWKIFFSTKKLTVQKMKDTDLLMAVAAFVAVDFVINIIWAASVGMKSVTVVSDVLRPSTNYITCDYSDSMGFVWAHVAFKASLLLFGVGLTYSVRNTPSQFNESSFIGVAIYNVSIIVCFVIPILSASLGGRSSLFLIRAFAIIFVTLTTILILYTPKIVAMYTVEQDVAANRVTVMGGDEDGTLTGSVEAKSHHHTHSDGAPKPSKQAFVNTSGGGASAGTPVRGAPVPTRPASNLNLSSTAPRPAGSSPSPPPTTLLSAPREGSGRASAGSKYLLPIANDSAAEGVEMQAQQPASPVSEVPGAAESP